MSAHSVQVTRPARKLKAGITNHPATVEAAQRLRDQVGDRLYPIPLNASVLAFVDPQRRQAFMARWAREFDRSWREGDQ